MRNRIRKAYSGKVASGMYTSASEVLRDGLRLVFENDRLKLTLEIVSRQLLLIGLSSGESLSGKP